MATSDEKGPQGRRRWLAVLLATVIMILSYAMFVYSLVALSGDEEVFAGGLLGIALGLVPGVFFVNAFVSQREGPLRATLKATGLWALLAIPIGLVTLPVGLVAGFGAGGVVSFKLTPPQHAAGRWWAVAACTVYTLVLILISPEVGLFGGAPLPFLAIALADMWAERSAAIP